MTDNERLAAIEVRLNALEQAMAVDNVHSEGIERRLTAIEDSLKWLVRLVLGGLIAAVMTFAISGGLASVV